MTTKESSYIGDCKDSSQHLLETVTEPGREGDIRKDVADNVKE